MFIVLYKTAYDVSNQAVSKWRVETDEEGNLSTFSNVKDALEHLELLRNKGCEAQLATILPTE